MDRCCSCASYRRIGVSAYRRIGVSAYRRIGVSVLPGVLQAKARREKKDEHLQMMLREPTMTERNDAPTTYKTLSSVTTKKPSTVTRLLGYAFL
jgi:hypothetical protein